MKLIATTSQSINTISRELEKFLQETNIVYVPRGRKSLPLLMEENQAEGIIVWHEEGPVLHLQNEKFFFHPSMAKNRLSAYRNHQRVDLLIKACDLQRQDTFLDCTLGIGADAIVASYFTEQRVTGLEASFPIAVVIKWGMKTYRSRMKWLLEPIRKIDVLSMDHREYLKTLPDQSFDVVYFDPMFRKPLLASQALAPLRLVADHRPLIREVIRDACRVARKRVVMKELARGSELQDLGFTEFIGSPHNKIRYGFIKV